MDSIPSKAKLLLLLGPPGVGKTTVIRKLQAIDERFFYLSPYTTRPLRDGERDKIYVSPEDLLKLETAGELLWVNELFGYSYGTPRKALYAALDRGAYPVLDWPVSKVNDVREVLSGLVTTVYIEPASLTQLRLQLEGRGDSGATRTGAAELELERLGNGDFDSVIDFRVRNCPGHSDCTSMTIYEFYLRTLEA